MHRLVSLAAALAATTWTLAPHDPTTDAALQRARFDWDRGDYVAALTTDQELLNGADAARVAEPIALQTGELFRTTELTTDGGYPAFSPDSRWLSFETGASIVAAEAQGIDRITHVRAMRSPRDDAFTLPGGNASFCPDGRHISWLRVEPTAEIRAAEADLSRAASSAERVPRLQALNRLIARDGRIMLRDTGTGHDEELNTGTLMKTSPICAAEASVLFAGAAAGDETAAQIYSVRTGASASASTEGAGFKIPRAIDAAGHTLIYQLPRLGPFRPPSAPAPRGAGSAAAGAAASFGILTAEGGATVVPGSAPALSRDGRFVAWVDRGNGESDQQRLMVASSADPKAATALHTGRERLDAPAFSPDGSRIAFQMMPREDWDLYVVGRDGTRETRVTREIQHDVAPQFLSNGRLLGAIGEPRHRRSYLYDLASTERTRLFHNNTVRTLAPEYAWVPDASGTKILIVAERDGNTVSPDRGVYLMDLDAKVTVDALRTRVASNLRAERQLREEGRRLFAPIAEDVKRTVANVSTARVYSYEKALFDFDSKHISRPGNRLASEYLFNTYASFGYTPEYQPFSPSGALGGQTANVIATLKGTVNPELIYVVSSHYDSVAVGPGADDDSSGTAALLETARALAGHPMPATIVFASFTGEEAGLLGSREFVRRAVEAHLKVAGALNNDMIGWANDFRLDNTIRYSNPGIRDIQHGAAIEFSNLITYDTVYYKNTDAAAYYEQYGDIVGGIGSYPLLGNPHYHQPHDLLETINHQLVAEVAKTTTATLMLLASSPSRLTGLEAEAAGGAANVSWTPSPEKDVAAYLVTWGMPDNPAAHSTRVTVPRASIPNAPAGTLVRVKAINAKGLEGWDWARAVVKPS
jgi:hypothetical protein